jgi:hypothetical protein
MSAIKRKNNPMSKRVGLWFNHNKAVIVSITDDGEERSVITSNMEHYLRYSSATPGDDSPQDMRDKRYWDHVGKHYDIVTAYELIFVGRHIVPEWGFMSPESKFSTVLLLNAT